MGTQKDDSAESSRFTPPSPTVECFCNDPKQPHEQATRTPDNASNTNATQPNPSSLLRRAESDSVPPHYWAPQPVHPPVALSPPTKLNPSMFQRRALPVFTPLPTARLYPTGGATREPNHGFSSNSFQATGAAVAVDSGMDNVKAVSVHNSIITKRSRKSQSKGGANSSASSTKYSGIQKSKASPSKRGKPAIENTNAYIDRITGDLAFALANLQSAQATIAAIQADLASRNARRALAASAATIESSEDESGKKDPARPSSY
ncbi:53140348-ae42-498a-9221-7473b98282bf [Sclerotinia trifoliorum]|uniref:53140348-ae42-498a-9221-7473b98282bf n=1 Tax=Sclerotinia trifoliorum TaxID=28548 RepID=A0A8H2ZQA5_9HELO|nr:53140348-ae42-498a-9221-7473b98282bf [Sclerotinia trifoliorum]